MSSIQTTVNAAQQLRATDLQGAPKLRLVLQSEVILNSLGGLDRGSFQFSRLL